MAKGIAADEEQRRVLTETLPPGTVADSVIRKLECSKRRFLESRANRRPNEELKAERKKWQNRIKAWRKVQRVEEPEWWNTAALVHGRVEEVETRIHQISVAIQAFAGKRDPDIEVVYFDILCTWELECGGELAFSRDSYSDETKPTGDLITYFERASGFILGKEAPGRHGIADIIDKYRNKVRIWSADLTVKSPKLGTPKLESEPSSD
jgi:hypothetical protein